eukprot:scaffold124384_cov21-Tisochrysis_lutea.AAC.2
MASDALTDSVLVSGCAPEVHVCSPEQAPVLPGSACCDRRGLSWFFWAKPVLLSACILQRSGRLCCLAAR